jgi:hypothetical protein
MPPSEGGGGSRSEGGGASPETRLEWIAEDGSMREGTGAGKLVAQIVKSVAKEASGTQFTRFTGAKVQILTHVSQRCCSRLGV